MGTPTQTKKEPERILAFSDYAAEANLTPETAEALKFTSWKRKLTMSEWDKAVSDLLGKPVGGNQ
jgi:hypothetical protein